MATVKGRPKRKDNPVKVTLYMSARIRKVVDKLASTANQSVSQFVQTLIEKQETAK
jgi:hypothetical protein